MLPLLLVLGGVGLAFALSGGQKSGNPPPEVIAQIDKALKSADPTIMRTVAKAVRKAGWESQATSLEAAADNLSSAIQNTPKTKPGQHSSVAMPGKHPGKVNPAPKADSPEARKLAGRVALLLSQGTLADGRASAEVKSTVTAYQAQERARGFYVGNLDGGYGPKTALSLAKDHGIVPPRPLYWPKNNVGTAKAQYKAALARFVAADPQRAEEWTQAMNVDND